MYIITLLKLLIVVCPLINAYKFPQNFNRCHRNDPDLDGCLNKAIQSTLEFLGSNSIPSLNLPIIDPMEITNLEIGAGKSAVNLVQKYHDIKVYGFSKMTIEKAHMDWDKKVLSFTMLLPEIKQTAKYDINGNVLVLPVYGAGDSEIILRDVTMDNIVTFKEEKKNDKIYFKVDSYKLVYSIKGAHYDFQNLFKGDKALGDNINKVINDNWDVVFLDVKTGIEKSYGLVFENIAKGVFDVIPINEIFP